MKRTSVKLVALVAVLGIAASVLAMCGRRGQSLVFASANADWWTSAPVIVAGQRSSFGTDVSIVDVTSGLASKNSVVAGTADIGLTAATPLALGAGRKEGVVVLGTYLSTSSIVGLAVPAGSSQTAAPPPAVAVVQNTISEWFLYSWLEKRGLERQMTENTLNRLALRPPEVVPSMMNGSSKSAVIWEPFLSRLKRLPGVEIWRDPSVQEVRLFLVTRPEVIAAKREALQKFLTDFDDACQYIMKNRRAAREMVERHYKFESSMLDDAWESVQYGVTRDVDRMKALILAEAAIAMKLKRLDRLPDVDYLFPAHSPLPARR